MVILAALTGWSCVLVGWIVGVRLVFLMLFILDSDLSIDGVHGVSLVA